jgi:phosphotransferase system  glucose/maltose/N-acetylglucosamine-specific IIC component
MLSQIQRFGGAMFTPVLLFPFAGIVVGRHHAAQPAVCRRSANRPDHLFAQIVHIIEEGGWAVFRNMPLIFAVGLPIGLAKQAQGRACLAVLISFLTWNYFINAMGMTWGHFFGVDFSAEPTAGSGLAMIAGIKTLDTSIIGAIVISGIVTAIHNRYFDKPLPVFLGIFQGSSFVVILAFFVMIPCAWLTLLGWPKVQMGIESLQAFLRSAGALGVWVYTFLERILIPTGLHHFVYGPFIFGPAAVEGGIQVYWAQHLQEFSQSTLPLKTLFPEGGFALHGNSKVFGSVGIALALWYTARRKTASRWRAADPGHADRRAGGHYRTAGVHLPVYLAAAVCRPRGAGGHDGDGDVHLRRGGQHGRRPAGPVPAAKLDPDVPQPRLDDVHPDRHRRLLHRHLLRGLQNADPASEPENAGPRRERNQTLQQGRLSGGARANHRPAAASQQVGQAAGFLQALGGAAISKASTTAPPACASRWSIWRKPKATTSLKPWAPTAWCDAATAFR